MLPVLMTYENVDFTGYLYSFLRWQQGTLKNKIKKEDNVLIFGMKETKSFEIVCCQELDEIKAPEKQVPLSVGEIRKNKSIKKEGGRCLW